MFNCKTVTVKPVTVLKMHTGKNRVWFLGRLLVKRVSAQAYVLSVGEVTLLDFGFVPEGQLQSKLRSTFVFQTEVDQSLEQS